jgi:hypothetical protein
MAATGDNSQFKLGIRRQIVESFVQGFQHNSFDRYFVFAGKSDGWTADEAIPSLTDNRSTDIDIWRNIIGLKQIDPNNVLYMIPKYTWTNNTTYTMYDETVDLFGTQFYIMNGEYNVYKCLFNNNTPSSVEPSGIKIDSPIVTSDGYVWKYMYSIPEQLRYFIDDDLMPVDRISTKGYSTESNNQWKVQTNAKKGGIEFIKFIPIVANGNDPNWDSALVLPHNPSVNLTSEIALAGATAIKLASTHAKSTSDYNGLVATITTGSGAGQRRLVAGYTGGSTNTIVFTDPLTKDVAQNSSYEIAPKVNIYGDGVSAEAYIDLYDYDADNTSQKKIKKISVSNAGKNYTYATATLSPKSTVEETSNGQTADPRPIISPLGGHGSDPVGELKCNTLLIIANVDKGEDSGGTADWITTNDIRQYGIVKNPVLNDTDSQYLDINGDPYRIAGKEHVLNRRLEVTSSDPEGFLSEALFTAGKYVVGKDTKANAKIVQWSPSVAANHGVLIVNNINGEFKAPIDSSRVGEDLIEFEQVGNTWTFSDVAIAAVAGFDDKYINTIPSYNCTWSLGISGGASTITANTFPIDVGVTGGSGTSGPSEPTGLCLDWTVNDNGTGGTMIVGDVKGIFNTGDYIGSIGHSSTVIVIDSIVPPEIKQNTGEIIYAQNMKPIERDPEQREQYQIILKF